MKLLTKGIFGGESVFSSYCDSDSLFPASLQNDIKKKQKNYSIRLYTLLDYRFSRHGTGQKVLTSNLISVFGNEVHI